jgi:hypothetical protein
MTDEQKDAAKKVIAENKERREESQKQAAELEKSKPTPTQEENDLAALGVYVGEKEDDGSGPDPNVADVKHDTKTRQSEAHRPSGGGYQTRQTQPQPAHRPTQPTRTGE